MAQSKLVRRSDGSTSIIKDKRFLHDDSMDWSVAESRKGNCDEVERTLCVNGQTDNSRNSKAAAVYTTAVFHGSKNELTLHQPRGHSLDKTQFQC